MISYDLGDARAGVTSYTGHQRNYSSSHKILELKPQQKVLNSLLINTSDVSCCSGRINN